MTETIDILVTGGTGQIGLELQAIDWPAQVRLHVPDRVALNLSNPDSIRRFFATQSWAAVINAGAWTEVDKAECDSAAAFAVNALAPAVLAELARNADVPMIQVSTDYVFGGVAGGARAETDPVNPINVYGASKLAGELAVRTIQRRSVVLRISWLISRHRVNFLKTMLRLAAERPTLRVVDDQRGSPTSACDVAKALKVIILRLINDPDAPCGVYHFANDGDTTWAGLAQHIFTLSGECGGPVAEVERIRTKDYPAAAARPFNSVLSTTRISCDYGVFGRAWRDAVAEIVVDMNVREGKVS